MRGPDGTERTGMLSPVRTENTCEDSGGYGADPAAALLPKMQAGKLDQSARPEGFRCPTARRQDAALIKQSQLFYHACVFFSCKAFAKVSEKTLRVF
ncbi:hypothetical protein SDC9_69679 [bioreactor metagenome]|uniref:Uncharacterized protein n=1 Tax=bioreactor metagenome TaxID=1076179 RepID=A0A644YAQ9_9ZZZZ